VRVTVTGTGIAVTGSIFTSSPVTKTGNFSVGITENWIICNGVGVITVTLPTASAFPGRATDEYSRGCHDLIKTNRAHLITQAADVASLLAWDMTSPSKKRLTQANWLSRTPDEQAVLSYLEEFDGIAIDTLVLNTGFSQSKIALLLLELQVAGIVQIVPGNRCILL
jgi:hypothetical protein